MIEIHETAFLQALDTIADDLQRNIFVFPRLQKQSPQTPPSPPRRLSSVGAFSIDKYECKPEDTLDKLVHKPLTGKLTEHGYIYIYTKYQDPDPRYVKIGFTTGTPEARRDKWWFQCKEPAALQYSSQFIQNAGRVEQLIQRDLQQGGKRRWVRNCPGCLKDHIEFFEMSVDEAKRVVKYWCDWMGFDPYQTGMDATGHLTDEALKDITLGNDKINGKAHFLKDSQGRLWPKKASTTDSVALPTTPNSDGIVVDEGSENDSNDKDSDSEPNYSSTDLGNSGTSRRPSKQVRPSYRKTTSLDTASKTKPRFSIVRSPTIISISDDSDDAATPATTRTHRRTSPTPTKKITGSKGQPASAPAKLKKQTISTGSRGSMHLSPSSLGTNRGTQSSIELGLQAPRSDHTSFLSPGKPRQRAVSTGNPAASQTSTIPSRSKRLSPSQPHRRRLSAAATYRREEIASSDSDSDNDDRKEHSPSPSRSRISRKRHSKARREVKEEDLQNIALLGRRYRIEPRG